MAKKKTNMLKIKYVRSAIGRPGTQKSVVRGLGFRKLQQVVERPDTPEIRGKSEREKALAIDAKHYTLNALSNANIIELRNVSRGKYFRIVAEVYYDGHCLSDGLIDAGLAYKYSGGTKKSW